ncbi:MAG: sigma-70 family RNA polymerase sigma factor [Bacteroidia bacterium]
MSTATQIAEFDHFTDPEIIQRVLSGDTRLYELIIRRNNPDLYKIGRAYGYNHHDVEDLMQETYVSAYRSLAGFKNNSGLKTWLTRIMLNHCYQKKQKHSYVKEVLMENNHEIQQPMFQQQAGTGKTVLNRELGHVIENALNGIPEEYRLVFTLRELNGLNVAETAELTQLSASNVKVRLNRAKTMLREKIEEMYSTDEIYEFNLVYCNKMVERVMAEINKSLI